MLIVILSILFHVALSESQNYTFTYSASDIAIILYGHSLDISSSLANAAYQEAEDGQIYLQQILQQLNANSQQSSVVYYNIIYFNLADPDGSTCYYNYFNNQSLPSNITSCSAIDNNIISDIDSGCINFTNCSSETFTYSINLANVTYKQSIVMIQNNNLLNVNQTTLNLSMQTKVSVLNSNIWFYWSVALTCLLLLSLVLLTGVVLYWSLKYRKAQRALEQLRLTEVDEQTLSMRKSLRKSIMKQQ